MTIEDRAKNLYQWDLHCNDDELFPISLKNLCKHEVESYINGATDQDTIARNEERERCIKIAQDKMCSVCRSAHHTLGYGVICSYVECDEREKLRSLMEGDKV